MINRFIDYLISEPTSPLRQALNDQAVLTELEAEEVYCYDTHEASSMPRPYVLLQEQNRAGTLNQCLSGSDTIPRFMLIECNGEAETFSISKDRASVLYGVCRSILEDAKSPVWADATGFTRNYPNAGYEKIVSVIVRPIADPASTGAGYDGDTPAKRDRFREAKRYIEVELGIHTQP
jgi:hypothetical protein